MFKTEFEAVVGCALVSQELGEVARFFSVGYNLLNEFVLEPAFETDLKWTAEIYPCKPQGFSVKFFASKFGITVQWEGNLQGLLQAHRDITQYIAEQQDEQDEEEDDEPFGPSILKMKERLAQPFADEE